MWIEKLNITNCRSLENVSIELSDKVNIFSGKNASGKTTLLEALSLLSSGRSFRTSHISNIISHEKKELLVTASTINKNTNSYIGIEKSANKTKIRINQQDIYSQAELSRYFPITVIHPDSIQLISGAPSYRRAYIDWIAFYLFSDFHAKWKAYKHILKQRNLCLKSIKHRYALDKWTQELIRLQPEINQYRESAVDTLIPLFKKASSFLLKGKEVDISFKSGLPKDVTFDYDSLSEYYESKREYDIILKRTSTGVHRANLVFSIDSNPAEQSASRGELKLLSIALLLSQSRAIKSDKHDNGIILIDDITSELDATNRGFLMDYFFDLNQQIIITTTGTDLTFADKEHKMFHVEHGEIIQKGI